MNTLTYNERIAIIIPVYKVAKYLQRCIDSVVSQDYSNLEIVLVNDGSPDECPEICERNANKDKRIKVLHRENGGLSDARNAGVDYCESALVIFIDADDCVDHNHVSSLYENMIKYDSDISCSPLIFEYENGYRKKSAVFEETCITNIEAMQMVMRVQYGIGVSACSKLFRKEFLIRHPFPKGKLHEDIVIALKLYADANHIGITPVKTYHYIQRSESITHKAINFNNLYWILEWIIDEMSKNSWKNLGGIRNACIYRLFELVNEICRIDNVSKNAEEIIKTQNIIRPYLRDLIKDPLNDKKTVVRGILLSHSLCSFRLYFLLKKIGNSLTRKMVK